MNCKDRKILLKLMIISLAVLGLLSLTACGAAQTASKAAEPVKNVADIVAKADKPGFKVIHDCAGRAVTVPARPLRVAALDSFAGEAMVMVGAGPQMVAAPNGVKMDTLLQAIYPEMAQVGVPMSGATINAETLLNLKPDLILLKGTMYENRAEVDKIKKTGIPFLVVSYQNMNDQIYALQMIGDTLGGQAQAKATAINAYYRKVINLAKNIAITIPNAKKCRVYHAINEITRTDGLDTLGYDWVTCVGAVDVSGGKNLVFSEGDYFASMEQIFSWDPDIVICNEADTVRYLQQDPKWTGLRAVREKRVYNIPVGATRWGQRGSLETFLAMLWLGKTIYPEYYQNVDLKQEVCGFYKNYLGLTLDDKTYKLILSGDGIRKKSANPVQN